MFRKLIAKRNREIIRMNRNGFTPQEIADVWSMKVREVRGVIRKSKKA